MISADKVRALAVHFHEVVGTDDVHVAIAGGAVRDAIMGSDCRDIDTYVIDGYAETLREYIWPANRPEAAVFQQGDLEYDHQSIQECLEAITTNPDLIEKFPFLAEKPVNLVVLKPHNDVLDVINVFNLGPSQALVSAHPLHGFKISEQFLKDRENDTCTVLRLDWGQRYTQKTIEKLLVKYPHLKVVLPNGEEFDWQNWDEAAVDKYLNFPVEL